MTASCPAIVCVGYNRPDALTRLLRCVETAVYPDDARIPLIVSIDFSAAQGDVRAAAEACPWTHGEKIIRCFPVRQGLRSHILQCGDLSAQYGAVVILEDDLLVAPGYYSYLTQAIAFYGDDARIAGFALYSHAWNGYADVPFIPACSGADAYLGQYSITWGQCWTDQQWRGFRAWYAEHAQLDANDTRMPADIPRWPETSWGKYFVFYILARDLYYVVPYVSLSTNCEEAGQHNFGGDDSHQVAMLEGSGMTYRFAAFPNAVRYDIFFERQAIRLPARLGIHPDEVCVDLSGRHADTLGKRYLLTCRRFDLSLVASFGLRLRPIEANVHYDMPGSAIRLYDVFAGLPAEKADPQNVFLRMRYDLYRFGWRRLLSYSVRDVCRRVRGRVKRMVCKGAH